MDTLPSPGSLVIESIQPFLDQLRGAYPELKGTDTQLVSLIADALNIVSPDSNAARDDADYLERQFRYIAESMGGEADYLEEDDEA